MRKMNKFITLKSNIFKTWNSISNTGIDLIYVISLDSGLVITNTNEYVIMIGGSVKKRIASFVEKIILRFALASKHIKEASKTSKYLTTYNKIENRLNIKSKIKKEIKHG